jgi:bacteriophage HK97-gp10 putative tail-component
MPSARITTTGVPQAASKLERIGNNAHQQGPTMRDAGRVTARAVSGVPVDTGRLASSIEVLDSSDYGFSVGTRVDYAHFVFRGTKYMRARPPRVPSDTGRRTAYALSRGIVFS